MENGKYHQTTGEATSYVRANRVLVVHDLDEAPYTLFEEERITTIGGDVIHIPIGAVRLDLQPGDSVPLRNPLTGEALGQSMSFEQLYTALYSAYIHAALARDAEADADAEGDEQ